MSFIEAITTVYGRYATFTGRSRRPEYWWWALYIVLGAVAVALIETALGLGMWSMVMGDDEIHGMYQGGPLTWLWSVAHLLPGLAVAVRRLHDTDRSGWWLMLALIPVVGALVLLYFMASIGTRGDNRFGAEPAA